MANIERKPLISAFRESFDNEYITVVVGQRQIGKTTFIREFLANSEHLYINFDVLAKREELNSHGLEKMIESFFQKKITQFKTKQIVFLDEAQKVPKIFEEIKVIFDEIKHCKKIKFVISGSSSLDLYSHTAESLAGRIDLIKAYNFNLYEIKDMLKINFANKSFGEIFNVEWSFDDVLAFTKTNDFFPPHNAELQEALEQAIIYGSMPDIVKLFVEASPQNKIVRYLENYKGTYIEKDIRMLKQVGDLSAFSKLFDLLCTQVANILVKKELCSNVEISFATVQNYLSVLENTFIIDLLQPYSHNAKKRLVKSPKIFVFDNGLLSLAHGFPSIEQLKNTGNIGMWFENFVLNELKKHLCNRFPFLKIYFYRTASDAEIDFILDYKKKIIPIEVKWAKDPRSIKLQVLKNFIRDEKNCDYGVVIYNGEFKLDSTNKIVFFPVQYFVSSTCYLIT